jgi:hypothetical protein
MSDYTAPQPDHTTETKAEWLADPEPIPTVPPPSVAVPATKVEDAMGMLFNLYQHMLGVMEAIQATFPQAAGLKFHVTQGRAMIDKARATLDPAPPPVSEPAALPVDKPVE